MMQTLYNYASLMRLNKPIGIFLLLWPTLIALWLASNGRPDWRMLLVFSLGAIIMRSAGCVINDYADRNFDSHVERTKHRTLAAKKLPAPAALALFFLLIGVAFVLVLQLKIYTILLSFVAVTLAIIYPFTKRISHYPQLFLGLAFAWSILMVYAQIQNQLTLETWLLFFSTVAWVIAYDTLYAMADKQDDLKIGIKSTAITFGKYDKFMVLILQTTSLLGFILLGILENVKWIYFASLSLCGLLILYQQWLIKDKNPTRCLAAFLNNNYFGAIIFIGIVISLW